MNLLSLAFKEVSKSGRHLLGALFILSIGFVGPLLSSSLKSSVDRYLELRQRQILSADLAISSLRPLEERELAEVETLAKPTKTATEIDFVTMGKGKEVATLIEVKAVGENFPLFGSFELESRETTTDTRELLETTSNQPVAWAYPEVLAQLGLKQGEMIGVGQVQFKIVKILRDGPGLVSRGGFAPRIYIGKPHLEATGLTQFGSQITYRTYLELAQGTDAAKVSEAVKEKLADPDIFLRTPDDSTGGMERFFGFFNLYLVSISMIVFALSWVSAFYILQIFLQERVRTAGILMIFGAERGSTILVGFLEVLIAMLTSLAVAAVVVAGIVEIIPMFLQDQFPPQFVLRLSAEDAGRLFTIVMISSFAFTIPLAVRVYKSKLQDLLNETSALGATRINRSTALFAYLPLVLLIFGFSGWLLESWKNAMFLTGGIFASVFLGWVLARVSFRAIFASLKRTPGLARLVALNLARSRFGVNLCFVVLLLGTIVLNLVPHLLRSAVAEIEPLEGREIPSIFLFNIPESSVEPLQKFTADRNAELRFLSPMILARLMTQNGEPTKDDRFQRFPVRLSFRETLVPGERIFSGEMYKGTFDPGTDETKIAEVTVEERFAERNELEIGDVLGFDVQGVPVEGRITSLRRVRWTEFNPNFFIIFQPGVLDDAPKTFLANVNIGQPGETPDEIEKRKVQFQYELVRDYPDMNVIDIGRTLNRVLEVVRSVLGPIRASAWIAIVMSSLILIGVISHNLRLRSDEIDVEKLMGADSSMIRRLIVSEYFVLALVASVIGAAFSGAVTWTVTNQIFEIPTRFDLVSLALSIVVPTLVTAVIAYASATQVLNLRGASRKL